MKTAHTGCHRGWLLQAELYPETNPHQVKKFARMADITDTAFLARYGLEIHANGPEDISAAARYKLDCLDGTARPLRRSGPLLDCYRSTLAVYYGAAFPVPAFLQTGTG